QVQALLLIDNAYTDSCNIIADGKLGQNFLLNKTVDGEGECNKPAGDGRRSGTSVCLNHITIDPDGPLPNRIKIGYGAKRAPNEPLDLLGPSRLTSLCRLAIDSSRRGTREH